MNHQKTSSLALAALALAASALFAAPAMADGFERGPDPTSAALDTTGSFAVSAFKISKADAKSHNYGGATVYYPKVSNGQTFGVVAMMPGFLAFQAVYETLVKKVASHGFVVINIDSNAGGDLPDVRAKEMAGALAHVVDLAKAGAPYASVTDVNRRAMMGNSMGGGALLAAAVADSSLKAAVALQPWHTRQDFSGDAVPTLIVACEKDTIAPNKTHSDAFYASLSTELPRGEIEVKGASHVCATFLGNQKHHALVAKASIAWLKRFLDEDMRYDPLIKGGIKSADYSRFEVKSF